MRSFTQAQIAKLVQMPEWMFDKNGNMLPRYQGRVFASNEGWMYRPTKVHPEYPNKEMPAYCISAIPELAMYMEATPTDGSPILTAAQAEILQAQSMSVIRRSATRYMVDISLDEEVKADGGDVTFSVASGFMSNLNTGDYPDTGTYVLADGRSTGTIRFDLRFPSPGPSGLSFSGSDIDTTVTNIGSLLNADRSSAISSFNVSGLNTLTIG